MRILHLCGGTSNGGAAKGLLNLHRGLLCNNIDSKVLFSMKGTESHGQNESVIFTNNFFDSTAKTIFPRIESIIIRLAAGKKVWPYSVGVAGYPFLKQRKWFRDADIIHLHWINAGFMSISQINKINKPVVWTMRDEWAYTGGCHYSGECVRFMHTCGKCPLLYSDKSNDISRKTFKRKEKLQSKNIRYIGISNWIADQAKKSALLKDQKISVILNGISDIFMDDEDFDMQTCRKYFGLPEDEMLLLCGATNLDSPYKGYSVLERFESIPGLDYRIVTFGSISDQLKSHISVPTTHLGKISDTTKLKKLYHACDVFLGPSHMEAFGKTLAEASACGLPVVAYNHGGPRDIVQDSVSGLLVNPFNEMEYIDSTIDLIQNKNRLRKMSLMAKSNAAEFFDSKILANQYINVYKEILNQ